MEIRQATLQDAAEIIEVYNAYILETTITFETETVSVTEMRSRIESVLIKHDWLVGVEQNKIIGYAYYHAYHTRTAYDLTVEGSIYLLPEAKGQGWGKQLYLAALDSARHKGYKQFLGVIAYPNPASTELHRVLGFKEQGVLKTVGYKFGKWIDVGYWQLSL